MDLFDFADQQEDLKEKPDVSLPSIEPLLLIILITSVCLIMTPSLFKLNWNGQKVMLRNWTLGEIVSSVASESLYIKVLEELPNLSSDKGIPKTFTMIAGKI